MVLDNASKIEDKTELKNNIPSVNLISNHKNEGYAAGNNIGIQIALENNAEYENKLKSEKFAIDVFCSVFFGFSIF